MVVPAHVCWCSGRYLKLQLTVKDHDLIGANDTIGYATVPLHTVVCRDVATFEALNDSALPQKW